MTTQSTKKINSIYFQNLDALRFIAAFSVFIFHFFRDVNGFYPSLKNNWLFDKVMIIADKGALGVNFFFVLSGFLITYLIFHEKKVKNKFTLWKFLVRRTLRIWPLYFIIVIIGFIIFPLIFDWYDTAHNPINYIFFLANFDEIWYGLNDSVNFLTSPWSVAVEEQFYLFWGIGLFGLFKLNFFKIEYLILLIFILSMIFRWNHIGAERVNYYHTLSVCQDILVGSFIGISLFKGRSWITKIKDLSRLKTILIYILGLGICIAKNKLFQGDLVVIERLVLSLFFAFVILDQIQGIHSFFKFGKIKSFNYLGKISYGLYMYHLVLMFLISHFMLTQFASNFYFIPIYFILSLGSVILVSALSYRYVESKFLNLKPK